MRAHNRANLKARNEVEAARASVVVDSATCPQQIGLIARDASAEGRKDAYTEIIAVIPPVVLGKRSYTVIAGGSISLELIGPRGGHSSLVRNDKRPELWAHVTMSGYNAKYTWYKRLADGTFTAE